MSMEYSYISAKLMIASQPRPAPCYKVYIYFQIQLSKYQPKSGPVVIITLEFVDKYGMQLRTDLPVIAFQPRPSLCYTIYICFKYNELKVLYGTKFVLTYTWFTFWDHYIGISR
jgi:hypothetical protein